MKDTPIIITIKHHSERCPGKNKVLLPFIASLLVKEGRINHAVVVSDSTELLELATSLSLNTHLEVREKLQDELVSCWNYIREINCDYFFLCPVTQPFKSIGLFNDMEDSMFFNAEKLDFLCSISETSDRSIFNVAEDPYKGFTFKLNSVNRKGAMCPTEFMVDGALYLIKKSFLEKVVFAEDTNAYWWAGNFNCVINNAPFMDIDTQSDMRKFMFLKSYFES